MKNIDEAMNKIRAVLEEHVSEPELKTAREFWVGGKFKDAPYDHYIAWDGSDPHDATLIHVREVLPGEIAVTREILEKAYKETFAIHPLDHAGSCFGQFCRALGLEESV